MRVFGIIGINFIPPEFFGVFHSSVQSVIVDFFKVDKNFFSEKLVDYKINNDLNHRLHDKLDRHYKTLEIF